MSYYNDPYNTANGQYRPDPPFNPYEVQQHRTYDPSGYGYEAAADTRAGYSGYTDDAAGQSKEGVGRLRRGYEHGDDAVPLAPIGEKTSSNMRKWRYEHQGDLWMRGGRASCFGRFFCCTVMIFLFLVVSIVLSLALWLRPPNIIIGDPKPNLNTLNFSTSGLSVDIPVDISVNNPNYFSVKLSSLDATILYPIRSTQIGKGHMTNVNFQSHTQTNFTFPIKLAYDATYDPTGDVLADILKHCGVGEPSGSAASPVTLTYNIDIDIQILLIPIKHTITNTMPFTCPLQGLSSSDIGSLFDRV